MARRTNGCCYYRLVWLCVHVCVCVYLIFISLFVLKLYVLSQETSQNVEKLSHKSSRSDSSEPCWQSAVDNQRINCLVWFGLAIWFVKTNKRYLYRNILTMELKNSLETSTVIRVNMRLVCVVITYSTNLVCANL